jgi:hypothetical protein
VKYQKRLDENMITKFRDERGISLVVVLMIMAILLSVIGGGLLFSGINTKITSNYRTGTRAFYAADTGINAIASTLTANPTFPSAPVNLGGNLCYRFGSRNGAIPSPEPIMKPHPGSNLAVPNYNYQPLLDYQYQINVTGTFNSGTSCPAVGAETAAREIEAQVVIIQ